MSIIIHQLFPKPVYFSQLERKLTKEELNTINIYKEKTYKNEGNITSYDTYVLENKTLKNLKKDLDKIVVDYFNKIVCTSNSITPYITQSWLNYTGTNQFHHQHSHPNAYISGVFYVDAKEEVDKIKFYKTNAPQIELNTTQHNTFNSSSWFFPVKTGDVILFPSTLAHGVDKKQETPTRISLAFNIFIKGKIGNKHSLTELIL